MHYTSVLNVYPVNDWNITNKLGQSFTGYIYKQMTDTIGSARMRNMPDFEYPRNFGAGTLV